MVSVGVIGNLVGHDQRPTVIWTTVGVHVCITINLDLNQSTTFTANLRCRGGTKNAITFKVELLVTILNS